jgi:hypothetical protein
MVQSAELVQRQIEYIVQVLTDMTILVIDETAKAGTLIIKDQHLKEARQHIDAWAKSHNTIIATRRRIESPITLEQVQMLDNLVNGNESVRKRYGSALRGLIERSRRYLTC